MSQTTESDEVPVSSSVGRVSRHETQLGMNDMSLGAKSYG